MQTVLLVIYLMVVVALIGVVLIQRSEGGSLGIGGSLLGTSAWSASITSRHTGAAPLTPETARIGSPSMFPTHTATV